MPLPALYVAGKAAVGTPTGRRLTAAAVGAATVVALVAVSSIVSVVLIVGAARGTHARPFALPPTGDVVGLAAQLDMPAKALQGLIKVDQISLQATGCHASWWLLGGVAFIESGVGRSGGASIGEDWVVRPHIGGPALGAEFGGDVAQGPFQFIPTSWVLFGLDGDGDGIADPHNFVDGALAAANHLCHSAGGPGSVLEDEATARRGLFGYNHSQAYVLDVWAAAVAYRTVGGAAPPTEAPVATSGPAGTLVAVEPCERAEGCMLDAAWAPGVMAALRDAAQAGYPMVIYSAYRSVEHQVELRKANCGTSDYAIYDMPSGDCAVVTARPGQSNHDKGEAVDLGAAGGGCVCPGNGNWEWLNNNGARYGMHQDPSITSRDSVHWSKTGN